MIRKIVINLPPVILGKIEGWIGKDSIDGRVMDMRENLQAVTIEENAPL